MSDQKIKDKILIVDDEETVIFLLEKLLKKDYTLETASNGKDGLEKVDSFQPDIILLDISMPELNGLQALREIRKSGNKVKIVFLTMHKNEEHS